MPTYKKKTTAKKGGPGKGGPKSGSPSKKSPSSMFKVAPMPKAKAPVTRKSSPEARRKERKRIGEQMRILSEKKRGLSKSTTRGPGLSGSELKAARAKLNKQLSDLREKKYSLTTNREVIKSKIKRATEKWRGSTTPGAGRNGKCTPVQVKSGSCNPKKNKTLGGRF